MILVYDFYVQIEAWKKVSLLLKLIWGKFHIDNKGNYIFLLVEGPRPGLDDATLRAEAIFLIKFTQLNKRFVLSLHYNRISSFLFVNATKIFQFKTKNSEVNDYVLCLCNISKDLTIDNMETAGLKNVVNFFLLILILLILTIF